MELTLDQALQKGIEAHKAGKVQEADQYYTAILKACPEHPDANHNLGVLAVSLDKVREALPFFKTALAANAKVAQFWISYIDALIKLDRLDDAKALLDNAKRKGAKGFGLDQIEKRLDSATLNNSNVQEPSKSKLEHLLSLYAKGLLKSALNETEALLEEFPNSLNLYNIIGVTNKALGNLDEAIVAFKKATTINPNQPDAYFNMGNAFRAHNKQKEAIDAYDKAIAINPNQPDAYFNMGNAFSDIGKLEEATAAYAKALSIEPGLAEIHNNMGNALKDQGKLTEAIESYKRAISIKPELVEIHNNMGTALKDQGNLDEAIEAYKRAISIDPRLAEAYNNMGIALKSQGNLEESILMYNKALSLKPDYAEANNNMGISLQDQGKIVEATSAYYKATSIKPGYANAYWNLATTAKNIDEAKKSINKCIEIDPNNLEAKLTKSALDFYEGDKSEFTELLKSPLKHHAYMRSFKWVFNLPKLPPLHFHRWALFDHMTELSKRDRPFYEFGVWRGEAFRYLIKTFKKGYGFDTFEGLPEDWHNEKAGTYSSDGNIPKIEGGEFIVGKFEDTLPRFFTEERPKASIINFDADLYSSTICALNFAKPVIDKHTILIFDEFIINKNWEQDEYKALEEFCFNNKCTYEVLAVSFFTKQVAVKLDGI